jgi:hypothetical protein
VVSYEKEIEKNNNVIYFSNSISGKIEISNKQFSNTPSKFIENIMIYISY